MKPLKLSVEGLKSISERQTVDFESLSKNGIFGIFGKTGSGKSTLLDAIVLAVYGEVIGGLKSAEFINSGCDFACVELTFAIKRGGVEEVYEVQRKFKFNKTKTLVTQTASLKKQEKNGEKVCLAENAQSVTNLLKNEIVGLEKSDFLKCIALPQGEFAAFVKMTRGERLSVIGKLFDLTKYGDELAVKIKRRQDDLKLESERLAGRLEALDCPSEQEIKIDEQTIRNYESELVKFKADLAKFEDDLEQAKTLKQITIDINKKTNELNEKSAYRSIIEQKRKKLNEYSQASAIKSALDSEVSRASEKRAADETVARLEKYLLSLNESFEKAKENKVLCNKLSERTVEIKVALKSLEGLNDKNKRLSDKKTKRAALLEEYSSLIAKQKEQLAKIRELEEASEKLKAEIEKTDTEGVLAELKRDVAAAAVGELASEEIEFLQNLEGAIIKEVGGESAVNRLIAAHIYKLSEKITMKNIEESAVITRVASVLKRRAEFEGELKKNEAESRAASLRATDFESRAAAIKEEGVKVRVECDELENGIRSALGGLTYENALQTLTAELEKIQREIKLYGENYEKIYAEKSKTEGELAAARERRALAEKLFAQSLEELNKKLFDVKMTYEQARAALDYPEVENDELLVKNFDTDVKVLEITLGELNKKAAAFDEKYRDFEKITLSCEKIREKTDELNKKHSELFVKHKNDLKNLNERCIIVEKSEKLSQRRDLHGRLLEVVKAGRLMEFIADEYLQEIACEAEIRVLELTGGRYGLTYDGNFFVTDNYAGGIKRPVSGLSGGETFIVSLCLALALSKQISAKALRPIDFFFLDEGFGTLDEDLIDAVTDSLEKLRMSDFTVGLITHVTELKNRIASKLFVHGATAAHGTIIEC